MRNAEYEDPRLVEVYDTEGQWSQDDEYFAALAGETPGARVLDLGCGTGRLALGLAAAGHDVTGIDPSQAALAAARAKEGTRDVLWILGTADAAPEGRFELAVMTGHVSQLLTDSEWAGALGAVRRALVPAGRFAFHAYDPESRVWQRWNLQDSRRQVTLRDRRTVSIWTEVTAVSGDIVSYSHHYVLPGGEELRSDSSLRFWSKTRIEKSLIEAGFAIERVHGGWHGEPVGAGDGELIFVARRATQ